MIETHKRKTRIQAHHKITDSATQTHTRWVSHFNLTKKGLIYCHGHGHRDAGGHGIDIIDYILTTDQDARMIHRPGIVS
jgi:hypothetical protein